MKLVPTERSGGLARHSGGWCRGHAERRDRRGRSDGGCDAGARREEPSGSSCPYVLYIYRKLPLSMSPTQQGHKTNKRQARHS
jgi:hypothetical protein